MTDDEEYRRHAAECQRMAAATQNQDDKGRWLQMAESWMRMIRGKSRKQDAASDAFDAEQAERGTGQKDSDSSH